MQALCSVPEKVTRHLLTTEFLVRLCMFPGFPLVAVKPRYGKSLQLKDDSNTLGL